MEEQVKKKGKGKLIIIAILTLVLGGGVYAGVHFYARSVNYIITDNAVVRTTLFHIMPPAPGTLERFMIFEGMYVQENEVLGWVENSEAMRSPVNGLVISTSAIQEQMVTGHEPIAIIADTANIHIQANIEETDITRIRRGQPAIVTIDTFGNRQFMGYISEIGRITHAELTGASLFFNTGGNFTRVTHLIPVEIVLEEDINLTNIIGVNARVRIPIQDQTEWGEVGLPGKITVRGTVESSKSRNVYSTLPYRIAEVLVNEGDLVTPGQVLARLDTEDLELTIAQLRADINHYKASVAQARQSAQVAVLENQRMLNEAEANITNNTNIHIITAEAALATATLNLETAQKNYDDALRDQKLGNNPQVLVAESALRSTNIELERLKLSHENLFALYNAGILPREELRQSENALTHARNLYNDARSNYENATEFQRRLLEQLETALLSAITAQDNALVMLNATRLSAEQEIEWLRGNVTSAQIAANVVDNVERMEIALQQMERQLADSTITAPISGTITDVIAREGAMGTGLLFVVEDTQNLRIITSFREYDINRISTGTEVTITSATGETKYTGVISRINPAAAANSPVVEFEAEVLVTSQNTGLLIGMNTRIDVIAG